ncbi:hopanoid biosynthesis-associated protein HpnK [Nevskia sp.]|uniref:hopanoid biosynthesis-associated protein HpnK n=1 Tax=Nevskia sp. TaxID=1929292 RepID=UPI0025D6F182|nr:hopanoid biosynthesis-associated protein HpnK [Nevskia sp.]
MIQLILNADDFGLHASVNEAVEQAHVDGLLTTASLMVGGAAAAQAVETAKRLPTLGVGLHLVLADGPAVSAREAIPDLVDAEGRFGDHMVRDGFRFFFLPKVRAQLAIEIRAQFAAFAATGLTLDHVNAHKHFHLHPTVLSLVLAIGREYGLNAVRLPHEPGTAPLLTPWIALTRRRLRKAGLLHNDAMWGLSSTGTTDETALLAAIDRLPPGLNEIYLHPATRRSLSPTMADYRHDDELSALLSPRVRAAIVQRGIVTGRWTDFVERP